MSGSGWYPPGSLTSEEEAERERKAEARRAEELEAKLDALARYDDDLEALFTRLNDALAEHGSDTMSYCEAKKAIVRYVFAKAREEA